MKDRKSVSFLKKYLLHHLLLGIILIGEAVLLIAKARPPLVTWGILYLVAGVIYFVDDLLAETRDISLMKKLPKRIQNENVLKGIGLIVFSITLTWFLILVHKY